MIVVDKTMALVENNIIDKTIAWELIKSLHIRTWLLFKMNLYDEDTDSLAIFELFKVSNEFMCLRTSFLNIKFERFQTILVRS